MITINPDTDFVKVPVTAENIQHMACRILAEFDFFRHSAVPYHILIFIPDFRLHSGPDTDIPF